MYIRFVVSDKDSDSNRLKGLFIAGFELRDDRKFTYEEENRFKEILVWFNKNLERPEKFARSKNPNAHNKAISWFKDDAKEHINKMRELAELLKDHGIQTKMIRENRIGYVVYEDEHQITAVPFDDTKA